LGVSLVDNSTAYGFEQIRPHLSVSDFRLFQYSKSIVEQIVLFIDLIVNSTITFMEANLWQNAKDAERKLLYRGKNGLWQAELTKQERKPR
jgi:hypothetical protein